MERIKKKFNGVPIPTPFLIISFKTQMLPSSLRATWFQLRVRPYVPLSAKMLSLPIFWSRGLKLHCLLSVSTSKKRTVRNAWLNFQGVLIALIPSPCHQNLVIACLDCIWTSKLELLNPIIISKKNFTMLNFAETKQYNNIHQDSRTKKIFTSWRPGFDSWWSDVEVLDE